MDDIVKAALKKWPNVPDCYEWLALDAHTGQPVHEVRATFVDEHGRLFLLTELGLGVLRSMDMDVAADALVAGVWPEPEDVAFADLPARFGHVLAPRKG